MGRKGKTKGNDPSSQQASSPKVELGVPSVLEAPAAATMPAAFAATAAAVSAEAPAALAATAPAAVAAASPAAIETSPSAVCIEDPQKSGQIEADAKSIPRKSSTCAKAGCSKPAWNRQPNEYCSRAHRQEAAADASPVGDDTDASPVDASPTSFTESEKGLLVFAEMLAVGIACLLATCTLHFACGERFETCFQIKRGFFLVFIGTFVFVGWKAKEILSTSKDSPKESFKGLAKETLQCLRKHATRGLKVGCKGAAVTHKGVKEKLTRRSLSRSLSNAADLLDHLSGTSTQPAAAPAKAPAKNTRPPSSNSDESRKQLTPQNKQDDKSCGYCCVGR